MKTIIKSFFQDSINRWVLIPLVVLISLTIVYFSNINEFRASPDNTNLNFSFFNDSANNGHSEIINGIIHDTVLQYNFELKEGFSTPYVGLHIKGQKDSSISLGKNNQVTIDMHTEGLKNMGLYISTFYNDTSVKELIYFHSFSVLNGRNKYIIDLNKLKIPDWYLETNLLLNKGPIKPNFKQVKFINITTAYPVKVGDPGFVKTYSISFNRNNEVLIAYLLGGLLLILIVLIFVYSIKTRLKKQNEIVTIAYKPIDLSDSNYKAEEYLTFINNNFSNPELTLELVSKHTGIGQRSIANLIQEKFSCNFKTYINQIRLNESKRLLLKTDLNIGEISYKVGFNNQSHFNRVFKSLTNISPGTYREQNL